MLQKRLDYGFNGYQVPPTPRAARSARKRVSSWKKAEDNHMCAFDLLATVAGKLLLEGESSAPSSTDAFREEGCEVHGDAAKAEQAEQQVEDPMDVNLCDQGSCNRSFFVSELLSQSPVVNHSVKDSLHAQNDTCSGLASGITISDFSEKVVSAPKVVNGESRNAVVDVNSSGCKVLFGCKLDDSSNKQIKTEPPNTGNKSIGARADMLSLEDPGVWSKNNPALVTSDNSVKLPFSKDHTTRGSFPVCQDNVKLVIRDDDEKSSGCTQPRTLNKAFRPQQRLGDRRIRRLLASKYWKVAPKLKDEMHFSNDSEMKPVYRNRKNCFKRQRSLRDYPFKKRRLYELSSVSNSDEGISSDGRSSSPGKGFKEDGSSSGVKSPGATGTASFAAGQQASFRARDSHVKFKIKSFRVPELFIEIPETATVGSLKRTVMEAITAILQGDLRVGVLLQGKKIRDDNKTLLQTGISHDNKLDALGFTLEPNPPQTPLPLCPEDHSFLRPCDTPQPLTRYPPAPTIVNPVIQLGISDAAVPDPPVTNFGNLIESDHDSAPSPPDMSIDKRVTDSMALISVPAMNVEALSVVPMRKSKRAEVAQRRIRRPFSVSEVEALVQAVEKLGTGRWRDVKLRAFDNAKHRTYVDLKDKWKTLVHTARISPQQRRGEPVPQELLDRVLAAHAYWSHHQAKQQFKPQPETCLLL